MHVCVFPHGFKGRNESCRELQNGSELGPSEGEFDWFLGGGCCQLRGLAGVGPVFEGFERGDSSVSAAF